LIDWDRIVRVSIIDVLLREGIDINTHEEYQKLATEIAEQVEPYFRAKFEDSLTN
jgi:hypothetical protein